MVRRKIMKRCRFLRLISKLAPLVGLSLVAALGVAQPKQKDYAPGLAPDTVDGDLWAAECLAAPQATADCNRRALQEGKPGGLLIAPGRFTLLLLDGRILRHSCPQLGLPPSRMRARGFLHKDGRAMSVVQLLALCGKSWQSVNLPYSGTEGAAAEVGNE
jgi:hypothetical protein